MFCKNNSITKKDFISLSLSYFEKQGINPAKHESPRAEMEKVTKRLDQFFGFMKKQEQDILKPMYKDFIEADRKTKKNLEVVVENQKILNEMQHKNLTDVIEGARLLLNNIDATIKKGNSSIQEEYKLTQAENQKIQNGILELCKYLDKKGKQGLLDKIKDSF